MVKVKDVYGDRPSVSFDITDDITETAAVNPNNIWADFDQETNSMTIYVTGRPLPGLHVYLGNDIYVIVDSESHPIRFYIEAWERRYVPDHPMIQDAWVQIRPTVPAEEGWNPLLRMLALWMVMILGHAGNSNLPPHVEPQIQPV